MPVTKAFPGTDVLSLPQRVLCPVSHAGEAVTVHLTRHLHTVAAVLCPHAVVICGNAFSCAPQIAARFRPAQGP